MRIVLSKLLVPFTVPDISSLARSLREQLAGLDHAPSHVEMLNMLARATGHANFQHLRAQTPSQNNAEPAPETPAGRFDHVRIEKVLRHFDAAGVMQRWPGKTNHQNLCLWAIWSRIPPGQRFTESEINDFITDGHSFGDYAILRRSLVNAEMLARTQAGRIYRRIEKAQDADAKALLAALALRIVA
jgi:hypothetical protein